jgi:hypothetical protein
MPPTSIPELIRWANGNNKPYHEYFAQWARRNGYTNVNDALVWFGDNVDPDNEWGDDYETLIDASEHDPKAKELMKVYKCYEEIVFDWPDDYRQMNMKEGNDGNLANNAKPYKKVTQRDVIQGAQGKDEMGGKKKKVSEARVMEESEYTYEKIGRILAQENPTMNSDSDEFANAVYHELIQMGMTPKSANYKLNYDPDFLGDVATSYGHYVRHDTVDEGEFTQHYMDANKPSKVRQDAEIAKAPQQHTPWSVDPINAATDRAGSFLKNLGQPKKTFEGKNMKDIQLESWEKELNSLLNLNEGITVSSSTGQQGSPDSVSVNATDGDAQQLLQVLRSAGVGVFGGEQEHSDYGAPMGGHEPTGAGSEPEMSPAVVGDGDDMMALIKKMSGIQDSGEPEGTASSDYESEEGSDDDHQEQHGSDGHSHEEDGKEETDEGNMFTGNLAKAREQGKKQADLDGDGDMEQVKEQGHDHEDHGTCNECGMYEARCVCEPGEEAVDEAVDLTKRPDSDPNADARVAAWQANKPEPKVQMNFKTAFARKPAPGQQPVVADEGVDLRKPGMSDEQYASMGQKSPAQAPYKNPAIQAKHDELRKTASGQQVANEPVAEDYANEAGHEEMAQLKHLLSMGNDMHKEKRSQAVGDPKQVTFETKLLKDSTSLLQDFKKLSGIK